MRNFIFNAVFVVFTILLLSCEKEQTSSTSQAVGLQNGLIILNEGNYYSQIDGSVSFLSLTDSVMNNNVFTTVNGKSIGNTPNDIVSAAGRFFIAVTDENLVWVTDDSLRIICQITIPQPRHLTTMNDVVFVSTYEGRVYSIDAYTLDKKQSDIVGSCLEDITNRAGYIYVCNAFTPGANYDYSYHTNIIKLDDNLQKISDINVTCNPTQIETYGDDIYLLSQGNYADTNSSIQRITVSDQVEPLHIEATAFTIAGDNLYYISTTYAADWSQHTEYRVMDLTTRTSSIFTLGNDIAYPSSIYADQETNNVYITSLKLSEYGYGDYNSPGYVVCYNPQGIPIKKFTVGVCPKTMLKVK